MLAAWLSPPALVQLLARSSTERLRADFAEQGMADLRPLLSARSGMKITPRRLGAFTRQAADGVTIAVDDGFARALKAGRVAMKPGIDRLDGPQVRFADGTSCAPDVVICATGYRPGLEQLAGHLVTLDRHGMPPFTGAASSPRHPGLWFFGLDRSIYGNMHVHRRQARQLGRAITKRTPD
jgi:hypothetical protein